MSVLIVFQRRLLPFSDSDNGCLIVSKSLQVISYYGISSYERAWIQLLSPAIRSDKTRGQSRIDSSLDRTFFCRCRLSTRNILTTTVTLYIHILHLLSLIDISELLNIIGMWPTLVALCHVAKKLRTDYPWYADFIFEVSLSSNWVVIYLDAEKPSYIV